jgi:hypothetical protein
MIGIRQEKQMSPGAARSAAQMTGLVPQFLSQD